MVSKTGVHMLRQAALICLVLAACPANAANSFPIPKHMPWPQAREMLIAKGFSPVPVLGGREEYVCRHHPTLCKSYPELMSCSLGVQYCDYLFRRPHRGLWIVVVEGEEGLDGRLQFDRARQASAYDLEGLTIANGARQAR